MAKTIDLETKSSDETKAVAGPAERCPILFASNLESLDGLPKGRFSFSGVGKVVSRREADKDHGGCSFELEVHEISPGEEMDDEEDYSEDAGDKLEEALGEIEKKKK